MNWLLRPAKPTRDGGRLSPCLGHGPGYGGGGGGGGGGGVVGVGKGGGREGTKHAATRLS